MTYCFLVVGLICASLVKFSFPPQIPNYGLALAVAHEWAATKDKIIPSFMHLVSHRGTWCCESLLKIGCGELTG